ncbi:MAG: DoxX family protein [Planctomycetes bacterium]|nr:DoxX family protein [Planctomycetota bacterium]
MEPSIAAARFRSLASPILNLTQQAAPALTRAVLGTAFVQTGLGKWEHFSRTVEFFESIGIPAPAANAAFIASLEVAGGAALVLGLGTRAFSALLGCTMVTAIATAERNAFLAALRPGAEKGLLDVVPFVYLLLLSGLAAFGGGALSLDRLLFGRPSMGAPFRPAGAQGASL